MDISLIGAALIWFLTGFRQEQVRGYWNKHYCTFYFAGPHLVLRVLCYWLRPHLRREQPSLQWHFREHLCIAQSEYHVGCFKP